MRKTKAKIQQETLLEKIKMNYRSLLLGILSVIVVLFLFIKLDPLKQLTQNFNKPTPQPTQQAQTATDSAKMNTYEVKEGDSLWTIAEKTYGSGFEAYKIAEANNITEANVVDIGQKLTLPKLEKKAEATLSAQIEPQGEITQQAAFDQKGADTSKTYTIKEGDYLWKIAQEVYGDGYQWVKIAQANNLTEPSIIHVGNVLVIPQ